MVFRRIRVGVMVVYRGLVKTGRLVFSDCLPCGHSVCCPVPVDHFLFFPI